MITLRPAKERGHFKNDWLDSRNTFSFGEYHDPEHMGVSVLRVINDDKVIAGAGFPTHPHNNMEIISYVLEGELEHKDSMGNGSVIRPGDVQRMSAGKGVTHSEFNPSDNQGTNFLQIWFLPNQRGIQPGYEQKYFEAEEKQGQLKLLVSPDGHNGSIQASTEALMYGSILDKDQMVGHTLKPDRVAFIHVTKGSVAINGQLLNDGDGATISDELTIKLIGRGVDKNSTEILLFDLPK